MVEKSEANIKPISSYSVLKQLWDIARNYKVWIIISIFTSLISAICNISQVYIINQMVNGSINGQDMNKFFKLIGIIIAITVIWVTCKYLTKYTSGYYSTYIIVDLKKSFTKHIEKIPVSCIEKKHTGDIISRFVNDVQTIESFISRDLLDLMYLPCIFFASLIFMINISIKLVLACFFITPFAVYLSNYISQPIKKRSREYHMQLGNANNIVHDITYGISIIKSFNLENSLYKKYKKLLAIVLDNAISIEKIKAYMLPVIVSTFGLPQIICLIYGGILSMRGEISPGDLVSYTLLLKYIINPVSRLPRFIADFKNLLGAEERILEIMNIDIEREDGDKIEISKDENTAIEFKDVTFKYDNSKTVLDNLNFKLEQGKITALIGPSGGGKSTIVDLLCGFYELDKGKIFYFGRDMRELSLKEIRKKISIVSQDTYLFPDSIEANIKYGKQNASREEVIKAAKEANAHEFILEMENGYDTLIGENGIKLSGGQRQRIAIARAMLKNSEILLLDEPTSALDNFSEAQVQKAIENITRNHTVLIIAHRLTTIKNADIVLVLNNGQIQEKGTHNSLMKKGGMYKELYLKQFSFKDDNSLNGKEGERIS